MNLVGYLSRSRGFPAPLVSVGREGQDFFAFFPSGDKVRLRDVASFDSLEGRRSFIPVKEDGGGEMPKLAFAVSPETVFAGAEPKVGRLLRSYIAAEGQRLPNDDAEAIKAFLLSIGEYVGRMNARELKAFLEGRKRIVASVKARQLRRGRGVAKRLVVQTVEKGLEKTLYRKGIPRDKALEEVRIPSSTVQFLQQSLF